MTMAYSQLSRNTTRTHGPSLNIRAQIELKERLARENRVKTERTTWPKHNRMRKTPGSWGRKRGVYR